MNSTKKISVTIRILFIATCFVLFGVNVANGQQQDWKMIKPISTLFEKTNPVGNDWILLEDSEDLETNGIYGKRKALKVSKLIVNISGVRDTVDIILDTLNAHNQRLLELEAGGTNTDEQDLTYSAYPDKGIMLVSGGTGDTIPLVGAINAGLMSPADKYSLDSALLTITTPREREIKLGLLYNWFAATYSTGGASIAPAGWHVPSKDEFTTLRTTINSSGNENTNSSGGPLKETGLTNWNSPNTSATNTTGFNGKGAGIRNQSGVFTAFKVELQMFSATSYNSTYAHHAVLGAGTATFTTSGPTYGALSEKIKGLSIRLIKNDSTDPGTMTDYDGNVYNTVKIGNQVWMAENLIVKHYNDGTVIPNVTDNSAWAALTTGAWAAYNNDLTNAYIETPTNNVSAGDTLFFNNTITGSGIRLDPFKVNTDTIPTKLVMQAAISDSVQVAKDSINTLKERVEQLEGKDTTGIYHPNRELLDNITPADTLRWAEGGAGDNWGTDTVSHDITLIGKGTVADPLKNDTTAIFDRVAEMMLELGDTLVKDATLQGAGTVADPMRVNTAIIAEKSDLTALKAKSDSTATDGYTRRDRLTSSLVPKLDKNVSITGATKTKITYDAKGLVTSGADASTADIADSSNKRYVTDAQLSNIHAAGSDNQDLSGLKTKADSTATDGYTRRDRLTSSLVPKLDKNVSITGATKTKITYDAKGLVTSGADASTADIADSSNKRYVTDTQLSNIHAAGSDNQDLSGLKTKADSTATDGYTRRDRLTSSLVPKLDKNVSITGATKTKITYDAKGLVTSGADASTADIADSSNKRYVTDAQLSNIHASGSDNQTFTIDSTAGSYGFTLSGTTRLHITKTTNTDAQTLTYTPSTRLLDISGSATDVTLPLFSTSGTDAGLVNGGSGISTKFLRGDNTWQTVSTSDTDAQTLAADSSATSIGITASGSSSRVKFLVDRSITNELQTLQQVTDLGGTTTNPIIIARTVASAADTTLGFKSVITQTTGSASHYTYGIRNIINYSGSAKEFLIAGNRNVVTNAGTDTVANIVSGRNDVILGSTSETTNAWGGVSTVTNAGYFNKMLGYATTVTNTSANASNNDAYGYSSVFNNSGTLNNFVGYQLDGFSTGTIDHLQGIVIGLHHDGGTMTNMVGINLGYNLDGGHNWTGTPTNSWGIYIDRSIDRGSVSRHSILSESRSLNRLYGNFQLDTLRGTGNRMVIVDEDGLFDTQTIPTGGSGESDAQLITYASTVTHDYSGGNNAILTLTGNITSYTLENVPDGGKGEIVIIQDETGGFTLTDIIADGLVVMIADTVAGGTGTGTGEMVYPAAGLAKSTGSAWATSITDNSSNWNAGYNDKVNSAAFNTSDGVVTLTQQDAGTVTVDIDGRYLTAEVDGSTTNEIEVVDETYNSTNFDGGTTAGVSQDDLYDYNHIADTDDDGKANVVDLATAGVVTTDASGVIASAYNIADRMRLSPFLFTDFLGGPGAATTEAAYGWDYAVISSGTQAKTTSTANHPGILSTTSSTTTNSGGYCRLDANSFVISGGEVFEIIFQHKVASGTNTTFRLGYTNTTTSADAANGCYFEIPSGSLDVVGKTAAASSRSTTSTIYTISVNTWYRFKVEVNSDATLVTFKIFNDSGTELGSQTLNTNIPTQATGAGFVATNVGTSATLLAWWDMMMVYYNRALTR